MPNEMNYPNNISSSDISDSQYVFQGGVLSLSNLGQLELILAMADRGVLLRTMARGFSMQPFIRDKDILTILPIKEIQPSLGDVVAFTQPDSGRLAIHRIIGRRGDGWLIKGDNCTAPDSVVETEKIIGRVCRVERQGKEAYWGIGKTGKLIAILNRSNALLRLKQFLIWPRRTAGFVLQNIQSLSFYRWIGKRLAPQTVISVADENDMEEAHNLINSSVSYCRQSPDPNVIDWVAKRKGQVIGFTQNVYNPDEHSPWRGHWLFSLHVRTRYRGIGIGEKLTMCVIDKAKEKGAEEIYIVVFEDNKKAFHLYCKLGFDHIILPILEPLLAEEKLKTGRRRIVMRKILR
jgi:ribosomal protein S18 acetylase RimI-like enzyme